MRERPLRLAARCPHCHQEPAVRVFRSEVELYADRDPAEPVLTVACSRCRTKFVLTAQAFQDAAA